MAIALLALLPLGSGAQAQVPAAAQGCQALVSSVLEFGRVTLDGVYFDFNRATLRGDSLPALAAARDAMLTLGGVWTVEGHTDNVGSHEYNLRLSFERAQTVAEWLSAAGVPADQLRAEGLSFDRPVADNTTLEGRALNRRVELAASDIDPMNLGFGGPADVEAHGCAEDALATSADALGADLPPVEGFGREAGKEWMPYTYLMGTGRTSGTSTGSWEALDLGLTGTPQMCQSLCLSEQGCAAWSFEPQGSYFVATARCFRFGYQAEVRLTRGGEPFVAGLKPDAEVLADGSAEVLAAVEADEAELESYARTAVIAAPSSVPPFEPFNVRVSGPDLNGDWIEIAELDDDARDGGRAWAYVGGASNPGGVEVEITAPDVGNYTLRYIVEHPTAGRRVITEVPLEVGVGAPKPGAAPALEAVSATPELVPPATTASDSSAAREPAYACASGSYLPCAFEDPATGLQFSLASGYGIAEFYFYETAGGVRASEPTAEVIRLDNGQTIGVLNGRQVVGVACLPTLLGEACAFSEAPEDIMALFMFAGSVSSGEEAGAIEPETIAEPAIDVARQTDSEPSGADDFAARFLAQSGIADMIREEIGDDPEAMAMFDMLGGLLGGGTSGGSSAGVAAATGTSPRAAELGGVNVPLSGLDASDALSLLLPRLEETR